MSGVADVSRSKPQVPREEFDLKYKRVSGDLDALRTQFTEMNKRLLKIPTIDNDVKLEKVTRELNHLKQEWHRNHESHRELSAREVHALKNDLLRHTQTVGELQHHTRPLSQLSTSVHQLSEDIKQIKLDLSKTGSQEALQKLFQEHQEIKSQVAALQQSNTGSVQTLQTSFQELRRAVESQSQVVSKLQQGQQQSQALEATLRTLQSSFQQLQQTSQQTKGALDQLQSSSKQTATEMQQVKSESSQVKQEVSKVGEVARETTRAKNEMVKELNTIKEEVNKAKQVAETMKRKEKDLEQKAERMKQTLDQEIKKQSTALESTKRDLQSNKTELQGATKKQQQHERDITEVKKLMNVASEFYALKHTLNNLGVLKPPKIEVKPDEPPPVGTIELADDCFTARLLTKLMYIKARAEKHHEMMMEARECESTDADLSSSEAESIKSYDSEAVELILRGCENVAGLGEPEIEEGAPGYSHVTCGWTTICVVTLTIQIIIVAVLVKYAEKATECFDDPPTEQEWLILHGSKALAVIAAGALMAKDFMDIVNETMVSILIEPKISCDTAAMNVCRFSLTVLIGLANVMLFEGMVSPLSVWINMAALAFVGEMGAAVAEQGKKGVFGHHIRSQLTSLNFELTFISEYPWWIPIVQASTLTFVAIFVTVGAYVAAAAPDAMCS